MLFGAFVFQFILLFIFTTCLHFSQNLVILGQILYQNSGFSFSSILSLGTTIAKNAWKYPCYDKLVNKLTDPSTSSKTHWSIFKIFSNNMKIPLITPLNIDNKLECDFWLKAIHFNKYFASKRILIENGSSLPSTIELYSQSTISSLNVSLLHLMHAIACAHASTCISTLCV